MATAGVRVDESPGDARGRRRRIDLVVRDLVSGSLQLDGTEQELGRSGARPCLRQTGEPAGEVDECDPHAAARGYR